MSARTPRSGDGVIHVAAMRNDAKRSRVGVAMIATVALALVASGCDKGSKGSPSSSKSAGPASTAATGPAPSAADMPDFAALLGTQADGWNPKVFAKLKEGMTPAEAEKAMPGAGKVDQFGFVDLPTANVKGVAKYRLSFLKGKLAFGEIWFSPKLDHPSFEAAFIKAGIAKWGKHSDKKPTDEMTMWFGPSLHSATLSKIIDLEAKGWQVQVALL